MMLSGKMVSRTKDRLILNSSFSIGQKRYGRSKKVSLRIQTGLRPGIHAPLGVRWYAHVKIVSHQALRGSLVRAL